MGFSLRKSRSRSSRTKDSRNNTTATPSRPVSHKSNKSKHANNKKTKNLENEQTFSTAESEFSFIVHPPQNLSCEKDDDVSSIHFCESVSSPTYCFAESSSPRKTGVPSPPPLKFVRSDSNINQSRAAQAPSSPSARESATPPINNTTQPLPALTSLLFLSLVTFEHRHSSSGKHVVRETLQRHAYTTAEQQQLLLQDSCSRARRNSVPVDVDDCNFVSLEELEHVVLRHLHNRNISAAIEVYETLLEDDSQQSKSRLHQQLSVLWVLQGNRRKAVSCSKLAGTCLPSGESQQHVVALMNMGVMLLYNQKPREALEKFLLALQLECKLVGYHFSLIPVMLNNVAICHVILEEYDIATVLLQESLQLQRNVGHRADLVSLQHVATSLLNLGICAWKRREYGCAINWLEEGLLVLESCHDSDDALVQLCRITLEQLLEEADKNKNEIAVPVPLPPVFGYSDGIPLRHSSYAIDSVFLGSLKHELTLEKRVQNAVTTSFCAGMLRFPLSKKLPSFPIDLDRGTVLNAELHLQAIYAHVLRYIQTNEMEEALELLRSTLRGFKGKYGLAHHLVGMTMHNIALVYLNEGKYKDADWYFQEAVSVCVAACGSDHPYVAASMLKLGMIQLANGNLDAANVTFAQVLDTRRAVIGHHQPEIARILNLIGYTQYECGDVVAALKSVNEACEILRDCQDCDQDLADTLANLGFLHAKNKKYVEAVTVLRQALDLQLQVLSDAHPRTIVTRENLNHALSLHEKASDKIELPVMDTSLLESALDMTNCRTLSSFTPQWDGDE